MKTLPFKNWTTYKFYVLFYGNSVANLLFVVILVLRAEGHQGKLFCNPNNRSELIVSFQR